ncbi:hypothetical protein [Anaeroselena agilis]|uniref:Uncharacterized protein n=1 Tax=Anaeroselena agilis TaxID=3063788 RepID=A0ABU3P4B3_9FIRM|nr:hypothetical protein [Selenomonadales bacterium 4137-cl]
MHYTDRKPIRLWGDGVENLSRIWRCGHCGAKIYCGRLTTQPACRCLCGKAAWRMSGPHTAADRLL